MNTHDVSALQKQILVQLQLWRYGSENVGWLSITTILELFDKSAGSLKNIYPTYLLAGPILNLSE